MLCATCGSQFNDGVQCCACKKDLDFGCAQVTESTWRKMGSDRRSAWKCPTCRICSPLPVSSPGVSLTEVLDEIRDIKRQLASMPSLIEDVKDIKNEIQDLKLSCDFMGSRIDSFAARITEVEDRVTKVEHLQAAVDTLETDISFLKTELSAADQRSRLNNVEIKGVPLKKDENLFSIVDAIGKAVNCSVPKTQINYLYRVPLHGSKEKAIVVSFTNRYTKEEFVAAARSRKDLVAPDIGYRDSVRRIYINDHLNADHKMLLNKVKSLAKEKCFNYVWVKFGKIHVRKNDTSPVFVVTQASDLNKLV